MNQLYLLLFVGGGLALSSIFHFSGIQNARWYLLTTSTLLAIGLYSSTYGISIKEARRHTKLILKAVTVGVILKSLIIGTIITFFLHDPFGYILGIIVAQIDPLSTSALQKEGRLSNSAKTILAAWSSFDDPITVILAIYMPVILSLFGGAYHTQFGGISVYGGLIGYVTALGINVLYAAGIFVLWSLLKRSSKHPNYVILVFVILGAYFVMFASFSIAIYFFWMLGIALIGLFMRPKIEKIIHHAVHWALYMAAILLGVLLTHGVTILGGIVLGIVAFCSQMIVGYILCRKLLKKDRLHIAFAQQNGITAIILALLFESYHPGTVAIVAPAILVINMLHSIVNTSLDLQKSKKLSLSLLLPSYQKLRTHL